MRSENRFFILIDLDAMQFTPNLAQGARIVVTRTKRQQRSRLFLSINVYNAFLLSTCTTITITYKMIRSLRTVFGHAGTRGRELQVLRMHKGHDPITDDGDDGGHCHNSGHSITGNRRKREIPNRAGKAVGKRNGRKGRRGMFRCVVEQVGDDRFVGVFLQKNR